MVILTFEGMILFVELNVWIIINARMIQELLQALLMQVFVGVFVFKQVESIGTMIRQFFVKTLTGKIITLDALKFHKYMQDKEVILTEQVERLTSQTHLYLLIELLNVPHQPSI